MGRSKQGPQPNQSPAVKKPAPRQAQQPTQSPAAPGQQTHVDQILALQSQIGNRKVSRLLANRNGRHIQRSSLSEMAEEYLGSNQNDRPSDQVHEIDQPTYQEMSARAKKLAERLQNSLESNYEEMVKDETGMKAINVAGQVEDKIKWAFKADESYADEYIGEEHLPVVLEQINAIPGLYEKLGLLRAMEPFHARTIGLYLKIPKLEGFHYKMTTVSAGGGDDHVGASLTEVLISCDQDGNKLWEQDYQLAAVGLAEGASTGDLTITAAQGEFDTLVYWGPKNFVGSMQFASIAAGLGWGYSFGVGTFQGDGSLGSLTIDMSGEIITTGEIGVGVFYGYLSTGSSGKRFAAPKTVTMEDEPKILVYDDIDKTLKVTFPEKSAEPGGSTLDNFVELLQKAVASKDLQITITGKSSLDAAYNLGLMHERMKSIRRLIAQVREQQGLEAQGGNITENESLGEEPAGGSDSDPNRDRVVEIHLKGRVIVKEPGS